MRSRNSKRAVAAALSAAFLLALAGDALGTHACPHHDDAPATPHGTHETRGTHEPGHDGNHDSHGPCTCVGQCHAGTAPPHPVPSLLGIDAAEAPPDPEPAPDRPDRPAFAPFSLPWANAPPAL